MTYHDADERRLAEQDFQIYLSDLTPEERAEYWQTVEQANKLSQEVWEASWAAAWASDEGLCWHDREVCNCHDLRAA